MFGETKKNFSVSNKQFIKADLLYYSQHNKTFTIKQKNLRKVHSPLCWGISPVFHTACKSDALLFNGHIGVFFQHSLSWSIIHLMVTIIYDLHYRCSFGLGIYLQPALCLHFVVPNQQNYILRMNNYKRNSCRCSPVVIY